ncbi:nuclear transport factor 2 family protein [Aquimarina sp. 2201CG5-10]|uniref:nuclear transport factor 2 family protein n=1 Tax=Aquimarina callyspongiae TaxID=3098150 RepID=UPI002AB3CC45|nr:nuclear transport factor 2 family protein [Aquimarina sp. 2201CG5-10]MDY8135565.1 nuclear transport factor 2 family protein [Aquimarina sp. 2201CG5-10]
MNVKHLMILFVIMSFSLVAQEKNDDIELITVTIENYFEGYINRDVSKLNKAFDIQNGTMKVPSVNQKGIENIENSYFRDLIPKWASREKLPPEALKKCVLKILNLDVVDEKMGIAKISMKVGETTYIDILSLQKINQIWKITNKIYVVIDDD